MVIRVDNNFRSTEQLVRATFLPSYKKIVLIVALIKTAFLPSYKNLFHIMVESGTSLENYKTLEISIRVIIEKARMLKYFPEGV